MEYRRLYQQEKEKIARRTLKSKANKPAGVAAMKLLGNIARGREEEGMPNMSALSGFSEQESNVEAERDY